MNLTEQQKQVIHHAIDNGWNSIEGKDYGTAWHPIYTFSWSMIFTGKVELRIKQVPDSINWEHVSTDIYCMARDKIGICYGYVTKVVRGDSVWNTKDGSNIINMGIFSSYTEGTTDWKDSLVLNPFHKNNQVKIGDSQK